MKKWKVLFAIGCGLTVAACGESSKIKDAVRERLKDPESVNFKDVVISENGKRACIVWNAKNSMGGYGNWEYAELTEDASRWKVKEMKGFAQNCSEDGFKALDAGAKANLAATQQAIEVLQKARNISNSDAVKLVQDGDCRSFVWEYSYIAEMRAKFKDSEMVRGYEKMLKEMQIGLEDGTCKKHS